MCTCLFLIILGLIILICLTQSSSRSFYNQIGGDLPVDPRGKNVQPDPIPFQKEWESAGESALSTKVSIPRDEYELHAGFYEKQPSIIDRKGTDLPQWKRWAWDDPAKYPPDPQGKCGATQVSSKDLPKWSFEKSHEKTPPSAQVVDSRIYGLLWGGQPPRCPWDTCPRTNYREPMTQPGCPQHWYYPPFKPEYPTTHSITYALDTTQIGGPWERAPCPPQGSGPDEGCPCIPGQRSIIEGDVLSCNQMRSLCNCQQCSTPQWTPSVDHPLMDPVS
jgi:hypothetical protein